MKIGILTMPLHSNYGGLLQAYALQKVLKQMGHEVWIISREKPDMNLLRKAASLTKGILYRYILKNKIRPLVTFWITKQETLILEQHTSAFLNSYIFPRTKPLKSNRTLSKEIEKQKFDAYVVGSDQVWRPQYVPCITNYFLDFVKKQKNVKKIAYAVSFGIDNWEFKENETRKCSTLAQKFDAVSVREDSGINLCRKYLHREASQVLDPTLLLDKSDYIDIVLNAQTLQNSGNLMTYILNPSPEKSDLINRIAQNIHLHPFSVMPSRKFTQKSKNNIEECIFPPVDQWLRGFMDAEYVVTDSFHGCAFSIIFNKPFVAIANEKRGITRFTSLLKLFDLENRLIYFPNQLTIEMIQAPINWDSVNTIKSNKQMLSFQFLQESLK
jgi:hypothetical protein